MAGALKSLTFAALPKASANDPVLQRRNQIKTRLQHQIQLAADSNYKIPRQKWVAGENGKELRDVPKKVSPWWKTDAAGSVSLSVRWGAVPLEFEKGKAAIVVGKKEKLIPTLETLVVAVDAGDLDGLLTAAAQAKAKKPA